AVRTCLASVASAHATAYREARTGEHEARMSVVVQRMVEARAAGVLFTADPVSARRDRIVVDAVAGLGDSLVSGRATPDHWELDRRGRITTRELAGETPVLEDETLRALAEGAIEVEAARGVPLDME